MLNSPIKKLVYENGSDNIISLGGIGTGYLALTDCGAPGDFNFYSAQNSSFNPISFFIIKATSKSKSEIFLLESKSDKYKTKLENKYPEIYNKYCKFDISTTNISYPFFERAFSNERFPGKINMSAWNPFIPNNDTDSGIPAALFEYEVENDTEEEVTYTIYGVLEKNDISSRSEFIDSRKEEIKYILLNKFSSDENKYNSTEMCIGVCGKDICFSDTLVENSNFCVISSSVTLVSGAKDKIRFSLAWYSPYFLKQDATYERKYYTRYFMGADECAFYCLSQWERLYEETDVFRKLLYCSTLPEEVLFKFTEELEDFKLSTILRGFDGTVYNFSAKEINKSTYLLCFFPRIVRSLLEQFYCKNENVESGVLYFSLFYYYFRLSADLDFVERIWKTASDFVIKYFTKNQTVNPIIAKEAIEISIALKDKKKSDVFMRFLDKNSTSSVTENDYFQNNDSALALTFNYCGQSIEAYNKTYRFCPDMNYAVKGVFQCVVCFGSFLGYIERGIDYIQLKCVKGKTFVRKIEAPDIPLKVKCGGYEIGFETDKNTAILDNDCEISPGRDLLVIFRS